MRHPKIIAIIIGLLTALSISWPGYCLYRDDLNFEKIKKEVEEQRQKSKQRFEQKQEQKRKQAEKAKVQAVLSEKAELTPLESKSQKGPVFFWLAFIAALGYIFYRYKRGQD